MSIKSIGYPFEHQFSKHDFVNGLLNDLFLLPEQFRKRVLNGELNELNNPQLKVVLSFVSRVGIFHSALEDRGDFGFAKVLIEAGIDLNAKNEDGETPLSVIRNKEALCLLLKKGARFSSSEMEHYTQLIDYLICKSYEHGSSEEEGAYTKVDDDWEKLLFNIIDEAPLEAFFSLSEKSIKTLFIICYEHKGIREKLIPIIKNLSNEFPKKTIELYKTISRIADRECKSAIAAQAFLTLVKGKILKNFFVEECLLSPLTIIYHLFREQFYQELEKNWTPSDHFLNIYRNIQDLRTTFFILTLLKTSNLSEVADLLWTIKDVSNGIQKIPSSLKQSLTKHLTNLQSLEKRTIWDYIDSCAKTEHSIDQAKLSLLLELGLDPNWINPIHKKNILFLSILSPDITVENLQKVEFSTNHLNIRGHNALEHHCAYTQNLLWISKLVLWGFNFQKGFPFSDKAKALLPDLPFLQVLFVTCMLQHKNCELMGKVMESLFVKDRETLKKVILSDPQGASLLGNYFNSRDLKRSYIEAFDEKSQKLLEPLMKNKPLQQIVDKLSTFGVQKVIQWDELTTIPQSFASSLLLAIINRQSHERDIQRFSPNDLLQGAAHDDLVLLSQYLLKNPKSMEIILKDYFKLEKYDFRSGGNYISRYSDFVAAWISRIDELYSVPKNFSLLSGWKQRVHHSFTTTISPLYRETIDIPLNSKISLLGRTVLIEEKGKILQAYKFLKENEKYLYFAQEHSATQILGEFSTRFKSTFPIPETVFTIPQLPSQLENFSKQLGKGPYTIYHYKAPKDTFEYLIQVPEEEFEEARRKSLHDAAKMTSFSIYPDLGALFHNIEQKRLYILLIDLDRKLNNGSGIGAGRLAEPFDQYPNMRKSGVTDLRDAKSFYKDPLITDNSELYYLHNRERVQSRFFYQMQGLCNILLLDMLILTDRHIKKDSLNWKDEKFLSKFANQLLEGISFVCSVYSKKPYEEFLHFAKNCGIDWMRMARQIAFWNNPKDGYLPWIKECKIPSNLYEEGVVFEIDVFNSKNFDPEKGFHTNGKKDIGPFNGPLPLDEFVKAMYSLLFLTVTLKEPVKNQTSKL